MRGATATCGDQQECGNERDSTHETTLPQVWRLPRIITVMQSFRRLLKTLLGATIGLVVIGVIVRATDSGMGCPDWPLCYGQILPPLDDYKAWLEWIHRTVAALIGLIALGVVAAALRSLRGRRSLQGASVALLALVLFQAWLGRQTVLESNSGASVTAHLTTAMSFLGLQVWVLARSGYPERIGSILQARGAVVAPIIAAGAVYALLLFGSNVTATDTGLLYPDWPLMGGTPFPPITALSSPQVVHRYATAIVALILLSAYWIVRREVGVRVRRVNFLVQHSDSSRCSASLVRCRSSRSLRHGRRRSTLPLRR